MFRYIRARLVTILIEDPSLFFFKNKENPLFEKVRPYKRIPENTKKMNAIDYRGFPGSYLPRSLFMNNRKRQSYSVWVMTLRLPFLAVETCLIDPTIKILSW